MDESLADDVPVDSYTEQQIEQQMKADELEAVRDVIDLERIFPDRGTGEDNIADKNTAISLKPIYLDRRLEFLKHMKEFISFVYTSPETDEKYLRLLTRTIMGYHDELEKDTKLSYIFREKLLHYIVRKGINLATEYEQLYEDLPLEQSLDLTREDIEQLHTMHVQGRKKMENLLAIREKQKFRKGDLVGARDKEGRWWAAVILDKLSCRGNTVYYVHYFNWGDEFDEFITDKNRIRRFNPKTHRCYYSVST